MRNQSQTQANRSAYPVRPHRRRRGSGTAIRDQVIRCRLSETVYLSVEQRARRAGLSVAGWLILLGQDAALGRPSLSPDQLLTLSAARDRLHRIGKAVNSLAAIENAGRAVPDPQLLAALARVASVMEQAELVLADVEDVFASSPATTSGLVPTPVCGGRRRPDGVPRDRVVFARVSRSERAVLARAAAADGLAVGAWLGLLAEAPEQDRPALIGEQYAQVERVRLAARRLGTNLAQITTARARRAAHPLDVLATTSEEVARLARTSLYVRGVVASAGSAAA